MTNQQILTIGICFIGSYLLGTISFGYLIGKLKGVDVRKVGSGNMGATNVVRTVGWFPGIIVFILDLLKGTAAVGLGIFFLGTPLLIISCGVLAILGHVFPLWFKFKGGRGSATGLGVLLGITPDLFLITFAIVVLIVAFTRYVSVASILGATCLVGLMVAFQKPVEYSIATSVMAILIIYRHLPNIKRLLAGTESKIGEKRK